MKTELPVVAPCAGVVGQVLVTSNAQVDGGAPLLLLEPEARAEEATGGRVSFEELARESATPLESGTRIERALESLRRLMLGFDIDSREAARLQAELESAREAVSPDDPELLRGEERILSTFADVCALFEGRSAAWAGGEARTSEEYLLLYLRSLDPTVAGVSPAFLETLQRALAHYGIESLERTRELEQALLRVCQAHARVDAEVATVLGILERRLDGAEAPSGEAGVALRVLLDRIARVSRGRFQSISDLSREVRYRLFDRPFFERVQNRVFANAEALLAAAARDGSGRTRQQRIQALVDCPQPLAPLLLRRLVQAEPAHAAVCLEILMRRYYRIRKLEHVRRGTEKEPIVVSAEYDHPDDLRVRVIVCYSGWDRLDATLAALRQHVSAAPPRCQLVLDLFLWREEGHENADETADAVRSALDRSAFDRELRRVVAVVAAPGGGRGMSALQHYTFRPSSAGAVEERMSRHLHPMMGKRLELWRLANFELERIPSVEDVYLFHGVARDNPKDERLFAFAEVRDLTPLREEDVASESLPHLEMQFLEALAAIRLFQSRRSSRRRLHWNRVILHVWPPLGLPPEQMRALAHRLLPAAEGLGLQKTVVRAQVRDEAAGGLRDTVIEISTPGGREVTVSYAPLADQPIASLSVVRMRRRGLTHPYELVRMLAPPRGGPRTEFPPGEFEELDLDESGRLERVDRPPGRNTAHLVVGVIRNFTDKHPEGMARVILLGDPSGEMGSFAEPECRRIIAAIDLAERMGVPLEWLPVSAGAKIAMDSGTENLDWTAAALRRLVEFTQAGGEVNLVVLGINVGGQSYWNAEATMLMHDRGILVMTPDASMVLTGKKALDYSGGVSAEDHQGIGGYERIMGVNGEAQYWAADVGHACRILFRYYDHAYVAPGERFPRRAPTEDPAERDVRAFPYGAGEGQPFETVGDVFSDACNPGRRKPFEIRRIMHAVVDGDHEPLERWADMREAEGSVVWDAHLGGMPVCLVGIESTPIPRLGFVPADGPEQWTAGTLFPLSSKKVARAINAASGSRPVVVLANLSGFDGSPESLRRLQLEYGAEIGRAVVNFDGPIVFCVISRYHGGAYVVFSRTLHENLQVAALEGSYASVIGGAPAAAVVFAGEVDRRTRADARLQELEAEIAAADEATRGRLRARWHEVYEEAHSEKLGEVADEFDHTHDVHRAQRVGSLHEIVSPARLRPYLVEALERGMRRTLEGRDRSSGAS
jgi:acetyl-CoA carboxylase carboxyltransferase component